eukprot:19335-Heterococcus_DN1.PRE.4
MTDTAEEVGIATAAVPLSYSQLYGIVEEKAQLTMQEFELRLHMDSRALGTDCQFLAAVGIDSSESWQTLPEQNDAALMPLPYNNNKAVMDMLHSDMAARIRLSVDSVKAAAAVTT